MREGFWTSLGLKVTSGRFLFLLVVLLLGSGADSAEIEDSIFGERVAKLEKERARFEQDAEAGKFSRYPGAHKVWVESLGLAHSGVLYPIGGASWRYVINQGGGSEAILFQRRQGGKAVTTWLIAVEEGAAKGTLRGTLRQFLKARGRRVVDEQRLTQAQRAALDEVRPFAAYYSASPVDDALAASFIQADGKAARRPVESGSVRFGVTSDEEWALRKLWRIARGR